jgi:hypothetical protein
MDMNRKHLLSIAIITALSSAFVPQAFAQLHLEIAKAPEQAPKIAIVPFANDQSIYPIVENDLNRSGRFTSASKIYLLQVQLIRFKQMHGKMLVFLMLLWEISNLPPIIV